MKPYLLYLLLGLIPYALAAQEISNKSTTTYALIVGISHYSSGIESLQYANRDAQAFNDFLLSKAGGSVPKENINLLLDEKASSGQVVNALSAIENKCTKDDLIYFYFSGHGDISGIHENSYLLCANTPAYEYINMALSIRDLNDIANTISAAKGANIVIITDACHSGKLTGSENRGPLLAGLLGKATEEKEIRLVACAANELSAENIDWGEGRGVFSFYLIKGLQGLADSNNDGKVAVDEIKSYLVKAISTDPILKRENHQQTPGIAGPENFVLSKIIDSIKITTLADTKRDSIQMSVANSFVSANMNFDVNPRDYFFDLLNNASLEKLMDRLQLSKLPTDSIPFSLIENLKDSVIDPGGISRLDEFKKILRSDTLAFKDFKDLLAVAMDDKGQDMIRQYLDGDVAEMEKRRYYNANITNYDVYPDLFQLALRLHRPEKYFTRMVAVKKLYFTAVAARLKMIRTDNPAPLLDTAWQALQEALKLEENAAYIYNELGIISEYKKMFGAAEKYYLKAGTIATKWAIPWANLIGLYTSLGKIDKGMEAAKKAMALQPEFQNSFINYGILQEIKGNLLQAEEYFRKSIRINDRHYLPFERLGKIYLKEGNYFEAENSFTEAASRKLNNHYHFYDASGLRAMFEVEQPPSVNNKTSLDPCFFDSNLVLENDLIGNLYWAYNRYQHWNTIATENVYRNNKTDVKELKLAENGFRKILQVDPGNPIYFHHIGKILFQENKFREAEIYFKKSITYTLSNEALLKRLDSTMKKSTDSLLWNCYNSKFADLLYDSAEDDYYLALIYEKAGQLSDAAYFFRAALSKNPSIGAAYKKLLIIQEKTGQYALAEKTLQANAEHYKENGIGQLYAFYKRMFIKFPKESIWYYHAANLLFTGVEDALIPMRKDKKMIDPITKKEVYTYQYSMGWEPPLEWPWVPNNNNLLMEQWVVDDPFLTKELFTTNGISEGGSVPNFPLTYAIKLFEKAAEEMKMNQEMQADMNYKLGMLYLWQGLPEKAIGYLNKSLELMPGNISIRQKLVEANNKAFFYADALQMLDSMHTRKELMSSQTLLYIKELLLAGRINEASGILKNTENNYPLNDLAIIELKNLQILLTNSPAAIIDYFKILKNNNPNAINLYAYTIARQYALTGNEKETFNWLEKCFNEKIIFDALLKTDPAFDALRSTGVLQKFVTKLLPKYTIFE